MGPHASTIALALLLAAAPAAAEPPRPQDRPQQQLPQRPAPKPSEQAKPKSKPPAAAKSDPQTPEARAKALANLYALLATAEDAGVASAITEAIERQWLDSGSDTVALLMQRSLQAAEQKNLDLAQKLLDAVVDLRPDYAEGFNRRAYVHYLQNDIQRALGDLRRALALEPNHYKALDGMAQILREAGEKKAALKALQQLQTVHPHWQGLAEALTDLEREVEGQGI